MLREFAARFGDELLKCDLLAGEAALQRARADAQFARDGAKFRAAAGENFLERGFHLIAESPLRELLGEFGFELRRDDGEQVGIVSDKGALEISFIEDEHV